MSRKRGSWRDAAALHLGWVSGAASLLAPGQTVRSGVACRRRPGGRLCSGWIVIEREAPGDRAAWRCEACGDSGVADGLLSEGAQASGERKGKRGSDGAGLAKWAAGDGDLGIFRVEWAALRKALRSERVGPQELGLLLAGRGVPRTREVRIAMGVGEAVELLARLRGLRLGWFGEPHAGVGDLAVQIEGQLGEAGAADAEGPVGAGADANHGRAGRLSPGPGSGGAGSALRVSGRGSDRDAGLAGAAGGRGEARCTEIEGGTGSAGGLGDAGLARIVQHPLVVKASLIDVRPPVWRRLRLPGGLDLGGLHRVLQVVFGWQDRHLHVFRVGIDGSGCQSASIGGPVRTNDGCASRTSWRRPEIGSITSTTSVTIGGSESSRRSIWTATTLDLSSA